MIEGAAATPDKKPLKRRLITLGIWVAVLAFVFGWLLPQFIDYELVWDAIKELSWWELIILLVLGFGRIPTEAMIYRTMLPGLSPRAGTEAYLSSNVAAQFLPPPAPSVVQYAYFRSDGFEARTSATAAIGSFIFPTAGRLVLPLPAFVLMLAAGNASGGGLVIALISLGIVIGAGLVIWVIGRSERSAYWFGKQLGRFISWVLVKFKRDPVGDLGPQVIEFRDNAYGTVQERWKYGSGAVALNLFVTYVILVLALRFIGVTNGELSWVEIFAAFALAFFLGTVIPITGSGLGVVDVALVGALTAQTDVNESIIVAGVIIWRVFYSFITLPIGAVTLSRFRKANAELLKRASKELQGQATEPANGEEATTATDGAESTDARASTTEEAPTE